jgi:hypothetical protein
MRKLESTFPPLLHLKRTSSEPVNSIALGGNRPSDMPLDIGWSENQRSSLLYFPFKCLSDFTKVNLQSANNSFSRMNHTLISEYHFA